MRTGKTNKQDIIRKTTPGRKPGGRFCGEHKHRAGRNTPLKNTCGQGIIRDSIISDRKEAAALFVILLLLWLIFSGSLSVSSLLLGVFVSALATLFCARFMGYDPRRFYQGLRKAPAVAVYLAVLLREIVRENFDVLRWIYSKKQPEPMLVRFRSTLSSEALRVLVANSITLTPGTYTVRLEGNEYAVHALDESFQPGIEYSAFFKLAKKVEEA